MFDYQHYFFYFLIKMQYHVRISEIFYLDLSKSRGFMYNILTNVFFYSVEVSFTDTILTVIMVSSWSESLQQVVCSSLIFTKYTF